MLAVGRLGVTPRRLLLLCVSRVSQLLLLESCHNYYYSLLAKTTSQTTTQKVVKLYILLQIPDLGAGLLGSAVDLLGVSHKVGQ